MCAEKFVLQYVSGLNPIRIVAQMMAVTERILELHQKRGRFFCSRINDCYLPHVGVHGQRADALRARNSIRHIRKCECCSLFSSTTDYASLRVVEQLKANMR